jgi:DNA-binding transcriptional MerR regulator
MTGKDQRALTTLLPAEQASDTATQSALSGNDLLLWSALPDLTLNIAQTANLCGVSVRQLGYWTKQGYVTATGQGARRLYGPHALRRILAIRHGMQSGLSLRQSLRALETVSSETLLPSRLMSESSPDSVVSLSPAAAEAITADLLALFENNAETRDGVLGLAIKTGRAVNDVHDVAEQMAGHGTLSRIHLGGETIYIRATKGML